MMSTKIRVTALVLILLNLGCQTDMKYSSILDYPTYEDDDLGMTYSSEETALKLWSPGAEKVRLHLYSEGHGENLIETYSLKRGKEGTWELVLKGDHKGEYYTYQIFQNGKWLQEKPDLYSTAVGVNGQRTMILDLEDTNPLNWSEDKRPQLESTNDIIIYEAHIRDLSISKNSGIENKGKYLGLTEKGSTNSFGQKTGLDHIKDLGVTHIHLLPTFDHRSIDEMRLDEPQYNWGYDPLNYNVPEGSFATNPFDGAVRVKEFKQMIKTFHDEGIRVILDVVYNHTGQTEDSNFNQLVPDYYYRQTADGLFSDASACGNETASERYMMRKYIIESVKYWAEEYHLDGFRFDLMGIHDIETMNAVSEALAQIDPSIFVYGEGWTAGSSPLPNSEQALKANTTQLNRIAAFSDDLRDGLKGSVFRHEEGGFVSQTVGLKESIKFGIVGSTDHPEIDYERVNYSNGYWANSPAQTISYVSCHDNHTLFDKLSISRPNATIQEIKKMHMLAQTIVLTSQGIPFLHAGTEMMRTKNGVENSYNSSDEINQIDWDRKEEFEDVYSYYQSLIKLRKEHPSFRMTSTEQIQNHLSFEDYSGENFIGYTLSGNANGDRWSDIMVLLNGSDLNKTIQLPSGTWTIVSNGKKVDENGLAKANGVLTIPAIGSIILMKD